MSGKNHSVTKPVNNTQGEEEEENMNPTTVRSIQKQTIKAIERQYHHSDVIQVIAGRDKSYTVTQNEFEMKHLTINSHQVSIFRTYGPKNIIIDMEAVVNELNTLHNGHVVNWSGQAKKCNIEKENRGQILKEQPER